MTKLKVIVLVLCIFFTGCIPFSKVNTIEETSPVILWYMTEENGKLVLSTLIPPLIKEEKRLLRTKVDLLKEGNKGFNLKYYRELKSGQLRMLLINEKVASKGIINQINTLLVDPEISQRLYLIVVRGNFDDYIEKQIQKQPDLDYYLYRLLQHYEKKGDMTITNLHEFKKRYYSPYVDPILPVFDVENENFTYSGTAIFKEDRIVGLVSTFPDQYMQLLGNDHYLDTFVIPQLKITFGKVHSKVDMDFNSDLQILNIKMILDGRIEEYRGERDLYLTTEQDQLLNDIKQHMESETKSLLSKIQKLNCDPLHIGTGTLSPFAQPLKDNEWYSIWSSMTINVDYILNIKMVSDPHLYQKRPK